MKKYIVIGIVVLVIILGGSLILRNRNTPTYVDPPQDNTSTNQVTQTPGGDPNKTARSARQGQRAASPAATIVYTEQGFTPETITIKKGETVTFKNKSGRGMWVASNPHPTHTFYPEKSPSDCLGSSFDACQAVAAGADWSYTFTSVGVWRYHDHLREDNQGTVIVQ